MDDAIARPLDPCGAGTSTPPYNASSPFQGPIFWLARQSNGQVDHQNLGTGTAKRRPLPVVLAPSSQSGTTFHVSSLILTFVKDGKLVNVETHCYKWTRFEIPAKIPDILTMEKQESPQWSTAALVSVSGAFIGSIPIQLNANGKARGTRDESR